MDTWIPLPQGWFDYQAFPKGRWQFWLCIQILSFFGCFVTWILLMELSVLAERKRQGRFLRSSCWIDHPDSPQLSVLEFLLSQPGILQPRVLHVGPFYPGSFTLSTPSCHPSQGPPSWCSLLQVLHLRALHPGPRWGVKQGF